MHAVWRVFRYLKFYPWHIVANVAFNILSVFFNLFTFVMIVPFVELLFGTSQPPTELPAFSLSQEYLSTYMTYTLAALQERYSLWSCLIGIALCYLAFSFFSNLCRYMAQFFISPMRNGITMRLRNDVYHHITILPVSYFNSRRRGDLLSRMSNDISDIEWGVLTSVIALGKEPVNILVFAAALIFISPRLFLYFLIVLPLSLWLISTIGKSLRRNSVRGQRKLGGLFSIVEETLGNIRTIKSFGQERRQESLFEKANGDYAHTMTRVAVRRELSSPLSEVLITLGLVFILVVGGLAVLRGEILSSVFILFVILFARLIPPVQSLVRVYNNLQKADAAASRIFEILDADEVIVEKHNALIMPPFSRAIEYCHVSFSYQDAEGKTSSGTKEVEVLHDINLSIPKGSTIALVGPSGSGKTTLVDLLPRFYDPSSGEIRIDGTPIREMNINSLRQQVALVSQNCILFNDTVANNIAFGHTEYTIEQIQKAAEMANADQFIRELPNGYDTEIGDSGLTLSGGQRQRLSIARALLKDAPILILDEATSALDTESEQAVQSAIASLMRGRTSIVIAHRLSTIRDADRIIVLSKGQIAEEGAHNELMEQNGLYKGLVDMQQL